MITIQKLKQQAKRLKTELSALYLAYHDPRVPLSVRIFVACVLAYAFSPIDLIPDSIPFLGYLDDLILVPLGIMLAVKMIPPHVMAECRVRAQSSAQNKKPKNWIVAGIIVIIWMSLTAFTVHFLLHFFNK